VVSKQDGAVVAFRCMGVARASRFVAWIRVDTVWCGEAPARTEGTPRMERRHEACTHGQTVPMAECATNPTGPHPDG